MQRFPRLPVREYPTVEALWYFLLTGDVPTPAEVEEVLAEWKERQKVPSYVFAAIRALPEDSHPMVMLSAGILSMQRESEFVEVYNSGKFNKMTLLGVHVRGRQ